MISVAIKMLIGNKASCLGIIFGIFLATLLISQQSAIFLGLLSRSYRFVSDIPSPNMWIMDKATESDNKVRGMPDGYLDIVRSTPQIEWAVPINLMDARVTTKTGIFDISLLYGVDDATLIGAPTDIIEGSVEDLRQLGGVIIDFHSANNNLATVLKDGTKVPLKVGDELEINQHRAVVAGISKITPGFYPQPIIFTTTTQFHYFNPSSFNNLGFIAAKTVPDADIKRIQKKIDAHPRLKALTREQFESEIVQSFLKTGILINFGLSVGLGIIIGFSIAGQIFYVMTLENMMYYALIKSVGGSPWTLFLMIVSQALLAGTIGFFLGVGATLLWGAAVKGTTLAFLFPWQLLLFTGAIILFICLFTAGLSFRKIMKVDPKVLMGN